MKRSRATTSRVWCEWCNAVVALRPPGGRGSCRAATSEDSPPALRNTTGPKRFIVISAIITILAIGGIAPEAAAEGTVEVQAAARDDLAKRAQILGDPGRGALLFYRAELGCVQCHSAGEGPKLLGPDLAVIGSRSTFKHIVESILEPSKEVREGYQVRKILQTNGTMITALVRRETARELTVLVPGEKRPRTLAITDIDEQFSAASLMPAGLINQLATLNEFYDLVSFLVELGEKGPAGAASLRPSADSVAPPPLPEYEADLDHEGLMANWGPSSFKRGRELYVGRCANCHGTLDLEGSLPNALRFADSPFRNGSDPLSMYRTLTHGYGMMLPQRQLVPQQKYDVIHYIREEFLKPHNRSQWSAVDDSYLARLPRGEHQGPAASEAEPWREMDYGPFLINTYEIVGPETEPRLFITREESERAARENRPPNETWPANTNFAYKGIAIRLNEGAGGVAAGSHWMTFDHDTMRVAGAWSGEGFIDWEGIHFNGRHAITPRTVGQQHFANPIGPGWANPETGSFDDPRLRGSDGRAYGPLPRSWARYRGLYKHGNHIVISYDVGDVPVLESFQLLSSRRRDDPTVWVRTLNVGASSHDMSVRIAPVNAASVAIEGTPTDGLIADDGYTVLRLSADQTPANIALLIAGPDVALERFTTAASPVQDLSQYTHGGPAQWPALLSTQPDVGNEEGPFAVDVLTRPDPNPWQSRLRLTGIDFFPDGDRLVACCWDGDVWIVSGIDTLNSSITWKRIASGLFQPLGVKVIDEKIYLSCRDQIVILHDLNDDGETDFYESFNNDHQVTDHFHEFAMGLQTDAAGNLYYAKSARHARDSLVPHHGTLLRVDRDGGRTTILANGFRAANGICLNPDGSYFVTDQEGHWHPMNRINRVVEGGFYGNMYSYGAPADSSDDAMEQPLCWPNSEFDRSPSELLWIDSTEWGPLSGSLLSLSYGYGKLFVVPHEQLGQKWQGGMCRLPVPRFPTGIVRARFHPKNGHLYACGMHAWASNQDALPGGLFRIRYTGKPTNLPLGINAKTNGIKLTFSEPVDPTVAANPENYLVDTWDLKRTSNYGSDKYNEQTLAVVDARVAEDGRSVFLEISGIQPTWCMQISYRLQDHSGQKFTRVIQNTVHSLATE